MDLYLATSYALSQQLTNRYSTSFSMSSRLFDSSIRPHIYAVYGMVRLADEIVDTYRQSDAREQLEAFHQQVLLSLETGYSSNPIIQAFSHTARQYGIDTALIDPFFASMMSDLVPTQFDNRRYRDYIYGSAEVIGLMCLKVFVSGDTGQYAVLEPGARALGAAYQKINFLRDLRADHDELGRVYFPGVTFENFDESDKATIITDIDHDLAVAVPTIHQLPIGSRRAVRASQYYYTALLHQLRYASPHTIKTERLRISNGKKLLLLVKAVIAP